MKTRTLLPALGAAFLLLSAAFDAGAAACAAGPYRAGCAGPHGAVVARRPPPPPRAYHPRPAYHPPPRCYWSRGVRICR
jgi:hypothetical protein